MSDRRLFHSVAEQISRLIERGVFPPGTRLPGERELAERFKVSRVTIREAEIALQAVGRIEIKMGSGVYVCEKQPQDLGSLPEVSAFELTEARSLFESEAAALAAPVISDETLAKLDELLERMAVSDDPVAATQADREFHQTIAEASNNRAVVHTIKTLWRMRAELPAVRETYASVCVGDADYRVTEHRAILDALRAHDPVAARQAMRQHFYRLIEAMLDATEQRELQELQKRVTESRARFLMSARIG
jgi:DNA-binding FadR family transcriptional regulator